MLNLYMNTIICGPMFDCIAPLYIPGKRRALIPPEVGYTDALLEPQPKEVNLMFDIHVREFSQSVVISLVTSRGN